MTTKVDTDTYIGCGICVGAYPVGALSMNDNNKSVCDERACTDYGSCVSACPVSAISQ